MDDPRGNLTNCHPADYNFHNRSKRDLLGAVEGASLIS
jgi:hypothetical protein